MKVKQLDTQQMKQVRGGIIWLAALGPLGLTAISAGGRAAGMAGKQCC